MWIEIWRWWELQKLQKSHSLCGSVDWNLLSYGPFDFVIQSLPLRECGLKFRFRCGCICGLCRSLPLRECGLKFRFRCGCICGLCVTPFAGVWIEIIETPLPTMVKACHSLCGSVDWNLPKPFKQVSQRVTPFAGVWIEIAVSGRHHRPQGSHSLCGSVDWNSFYDNKKVTSSIVTPFAGVWIEIACPLCSEWDFLRHSLCGSVDWNMYF